MSVDMYVGASRAQAQSVNSVASQQKEIYKQLQNAISSFTLNSPVLQGKSYDSAKQFFSAVLFPLSQGGLLLAEAVEEACQSFPDTYVSNVDSGDLKQSVLETRLAQLDVSISNLSDLQARLELLLYQPNEDGLLDAGLATQISNNRALMATYQETKRKLQEKLNKLMAFDLSSSQLFSKIDILQQAVNQGIAQAEQSWNASSGMFNVPSDLNWSKTISKAFLVNEMKKIMDKLPDITFSDWDLIAQFAKENPDEEVPKVLQEYLKENKDDIISDIKNDALSNFIEQLGIGITRFGGIITILEGIKGPDIVNSFVLVNQNGFGSSILKYGKNITTVGKTIGYGFMALGFGLGMYDDMTNYGKTVGQAISHNTVSIGIGFGAGALGTAGVGLLLTNPGGWAVLGGIAVGTIASVAFDFAYKNNFLGLQDGLDWIGNKIDDGIDWAGEKINDGINYAKEKLDDVGEAVSDFGNAINPMNWAW